MLSPLTRKSYLTVEAVKGQYTDAEGKCHVEALLFEEFGAMSAGVEELLMRVFFPRLLRHRRAGGALLRPQGGGQGHQRSHRAAATAAATRAVLCCWRRAQHRLQGRARAQGTLPDGAQDER